MRFKLMAAGTHGDKSEAPAARNVLTAKMSFAFLCSPRLRVSAVKKPMARDTDFGKE